MKESLINTILTSQDVLIKSYIDNNYRVKQLIHAIFKKKILNIQNFSTIPQNIRTSLEKNFEVLNLFPEDKKISKDGTIKYLFKLSDGNCVESVILKDKNDRYTLCISTQIGCRMNCIFCMTGKMGFIRNLDFTEIISQILYISSTITKYFNIVFMGMGEPLDNYENLKKAIEILTSKNYFGLSITRLTVSTSGIINNINKLLEDFPLINISISINSMIQKNRESLMPVSKKYPLEKLFNELYKSIDKNITRFTLEYVLISNKNINIDEINEFKKIKNKKLFLINVIPMNDINDKNYIIPPEKEIKWFCNKLKESGFNVTRRYRRGEDINSACGQLYFKNK